MVPLYRSYPILRHYNDKIREFKPEDDAIIIDYQESPNRTSILLILAKTGYI